MKVKMKPETIERRKREREQATTERHEDLRKRMAEQAAKHGPDSIYAEMLIEMT